MTEIQRVYEAYETALYVLSAGKAFVSEPDYVIGDVLVERDAVEVGDERS